MSNNYINIHFLSHFARTGSTFFCDRISRHKNIVIMPESRILKKIYDHFEKKNNLSNNSIFSLVEKLFSDKKFQNYQLKKNELILYLQDNQISNWQNFFYLICLFYRNKYKKDAKLLIFKKKESLIYYDDFKKIYTETKIIFLIRDPRAIFNSSFKLKHSISGKKFFNNYIDMCFKFNIYYNKLRKIENKYPKNCLLIKYENLLNNFEKEVKKTLNLIKIIEKDLEFLSKENYTKNIISNDDEHLHENVYKKLISTNDNKWVYSLSIFKRLAIYIICIRSVIKLNYKF